MRRTARLRCRHRRSAGDRNADYGDVEVEADLACGGVALAETPQIRRARETAELWLFTLHDGSAFSLGAKSPSPCSVWRR